MDTKWKRFNPPETRTPRRQLPPQAGIQERKYFSTVYHLLPLSSPSFLLFFFLISTTYAARAHLCLLLSSCYLHTSLYTLFPPHCMHAPQPVPHVIILLVTRTKLSVRTIVYMLLRLTTEARKLKSALF